MLRYTWFSFSVAVLIGVCACARPAPSGAVHSEAVHAAPAAGKLAGAAPQAPRDAPDLPAPGTYPQRIQRLARLGRLWGAIQYLHPYLGYRDIDWDAAALEAIPRVGAAAGTRAYIDAVSAMLAALGDPATRVASDSAAAPDKHVPVTHRFIKGGKGGKGNILVVDMGSANSMDAYGAIRALQPELTRARAVIFDLRRAARDNWVSWLFPELHSSLVAEPTELPAQRGLLHSGYRSQLGKSSGGYFTAFVSTHAEVIEPGPGNKPERVVFMAGEHPALPALAAALQSSGRGAVVAATPRPGDRAFAMTMDVDLGEGFHAEVRTTEAIHRGAALALAADVVIEDMSGGDDSKAFRAAVKLASVKGKRRKPARPEAPPAARWRPDRTYKNLALPGPAYRVLAAYRLWNVIDRFYPYLHLIGDWDAVLPLAIVALEAASSAEDYARAVSRIAAHIADTHTRVIGGKIDEMFPRVSPLGAAMVEGKAVVMYPPDQAGQAGAEVGDIIETIDGKPVAEVMDSLRPYIAGSTEAALKDRLLLASLGGKEGSQVRLGLHGPGGKKQVTLTRKRPERPVLDNEDQPYRLLEPGLGYVDLRVLDPGQVDAMFEAMKGTRAIIFDMRGYPRGTAWSIAPRLARKPGTIHAAMFQRRLVSGLEPEEEDTRYLFMQPLPTTEKWKYQGKTFMLINHDTISQAEHTGLFFEAANGTEFIGSNTSGANGDVTTMCLPGDLCVHFTGHDVRHADGRQLQRVGLEPHVRVEPTIAGVRAGKDEVLDAAIQHARARTALP